MSNKEWYNRVTENDGRNPPYSIPEMRRRIISLQLQITQMQRDHQEAMESLQRQIRRLEKMLAVK